MQYDITALPRNCHCIIPSIPINPPCWAPCLASTACFRVPWATAHQDQGRLGFSPKPDPAKKRDQTGVYIVPMGASTCSQVSTRPEQTTHNPFQWQLKDGSCFKGRTKTLQREPPRSCNHYTSEYAGLIDPAVPFSSSSPLILTIGPKPGGNNERNLRPLQGICEQHLFKE